MRPVPVHVSILVACLGTLAAGDDASDSGGSPIPVWIDDLGSSYYATREQATRALSRAGLPALSPLREAAGDKDPERSRRARRLLAGPLRRTVLAELDGEWRFARVVEDGEVKGTGTGVILEIRGTECRFVQRDGKQKYPVQTVQLDVAPSPIHFDLVSGKYATHGLLRLDGDELEITYGMTKGDPRPAAIEPKGAKGLRYFRLERIPEPAASIRPTRGPQSPPGRPTTLPGR